uniref:CH033 protein n=1 Tax=Meleagris gallopavo TaxID=9103 RepID=G1NCB1_MELGA
MWKYSKAVGRLQKQTQKQLVHLWKQSLVSVVLSRCKPIFAIPQEDCPRVPLVPASQHMEGAADGEVLANAVPTESVDMVQISALEKSDLDQTASAVPREDESHVTLKMSKPESAPGDSTVIEKSASEGATQKKKKKKKQNASVSKKDIKETEIKRKAKVEANGCQNKDAAHQDETSQSDDQLQKEVDWCVEQLEIGLKTQKSTPKQVEEALRAIKTLRSDKAPLVKKRQIMRTIFGDYRKKMEEELCKQLKLMLSDAKSAKIVEVQNKKCQVIRKRSGACSKSQGSAGSPPESPNTPDTGAFRFTVSQEEFRFNFF